MHKINAVIVSDLAGSISSSPGQRQFHPWNRHSWFPRPDAPRTPGRWDPNGQNNTRPGAVERAQDPLLVPNVIDVRIIHHEVSATNESEGSITGQPEPAPNDEVPEGP